MTAYKSDLFFGSLTGNGRILVVDDEPDTLMSRRRTFG